MNILTVTGYPRSGFLRCWSLTTSPLSSFGSIGPARPNKAHDAPQDIFEVFLSQGGDGGGPGRHGRPGGSVTPFSELWGQLRFRSSRWVFSGKANCL